MNQLKVRKKSSGIAAVMRQQCTEILSIREDRRAWLSPDREELDGGGAHVRDFILRSAQQEEALHRIWYALRSNRNRWIIGENLVNAICGDRNPSSKSSPIDRRTSRRREEDDPPGDQSPPPESVPDAMKSLLLLRGPEDEAP
ncbi:unnamed protein product [Spirodela intermedia]|uniref:Uncharacterized protein n=1 Tax=Spirodela intermedia TaxID=51605 RepID=A0A7I8LMM4_SPIIN|nr:unnamed protein product [Spirodela intermedia]